MNESVNYFDYANSPLMWAAAALAVVVVVFQSILFMKRSIKAASESALTTDQVQGNQEQRDIIHWPVRSITGHHGYPCWLPWVRRWRMHVIYRFC